jgi:hypothetical protein
MKRVGKGKDWARTVVERMKQAVGAKSQTELAKILGIAQGSLASSLKEGRIPDNWVVNVCLISNTTPAYLLKGEPKPGQIAAAIEPGDPAVRARLLDVRHKATIRNAQLRLIVAWMDETYGDDDEQAILLLDDMRRHYPSFERYFQRWAEKKQPGGGGQDTRISCPDQDEKKVEGC